MDFESTKKTLKRLDKEATSTLLKEVIEAIDNHTAEQRDEFLTLLSKKLEGEKLNDALGWLEKVNVGNHTEALNDLLGGRGWEEEDE